MREEVPLRRHEEGSGHLPTARRRADFTAWATQGPRTHRPTEAKTGDALFKQWLIYEQSAARAMHGLRQNRPSVWLRQPLKIEQLRRCRDFADFGAVVNWWLSGEAARRFFPRCWFNEKTARS